MSVDRLRGSLPRLPSRWRPDDPTRAGVVVVALVAVLARLAGLGSRVAQYDEAWIGYWILRYRATGGWEYAALYHGPFLPHVNRHLFGLLGASDFTARLPVALLGGLLPLSALLLRGRLRDREVVALAALLAANPLLLYYSRFMRFDLPLAAFGFLAVAAAVAAYDRGQARYLYLAGLSLGLATTTKENWLLYLVAWAGAGALVLDDRLTSARREGRSIRGVLAGWLGRAREARGWYRHVAGSALLALAAFVFFYAPRSYGPGDPGLWRSLTRPGTIPAVLGEATLGTFDQLYSMWIGGGHQNHPYLPYLTDYLATVWEGGAVLATLAVLGVVADRYWGPDRPLVLFAALWGASSVVGYPLANFLPTPWSTVHAVVPLAVPAAVGAGYLYERGRASEVRVERAVVAAAFLLAALQVGATAADVVYRNPQDGDSQVVYSSQSPAEMKPTLRAVRTAVEDHEGGTDLVYFGPEMALDDESYVDRPPACCSWFRRLPIAWYVEAYGATVESTTSLANLTADPPAVVVADDRHAGRLRARLEGYAYATYDFDQFDKGTVILVDADLLPRVEDAPAATDASDASLTAADASEPPRTVSSGPLAAGAG